MKDSEPDLFVIVISVLKLRFVIRIGFWPTRSNHEHQLPCVFMTLFQKS